VRRSLPQRPTQTGVCHHTARPARARRSRSVYHSHLQSSLCDPRYACRGCLAGRVGCSYTLPCEIPCVCTVGVLQVGVSVVCRSRSAYNSHLQSSVRNLLQGGVGVYCRRSSRRQSCRHQAARRPRYAYRPSLNPPCKIHTALIWCIPQGAVCEGQAINVCTMSVSSPPLPVRCTPCTHGGSDREGVSNIAGDT
jgi:hypothetical protein